MEEIIGELENKATGKLYEVKWDIENEISFIKTKQYTWVQAGVKVKTREDALNRAKDYLRNNKDLY